MPRFTKDEMKYARKFIETLKLDIKSSKHGEETNVKICVVIDLLQQMLKDEHNLNLEQFMRGALNICLLYDNNKYIFMVRDRIGAENAEAFLKAREQWIENHETLEKGLFDQSKPQEARNEQNKQCVKTFIQQASTGPLFIVSDCMPNTAELYFTYIKTIDANIQIPSIEYTTPRFFKGDKLDCHIFNETIQPSARQVPSIKSNWFIHAMNQVTKTLGQLLSILLYAIMHPVKTCNQAYHLLKDGFGMFKAGRNSGESTKEPVPSQPAPNA